MKFFYFFNISSEPDSTPMNNSIHPLFLKSHNVSTLMSLKDKTWGNKRDEN
jgi:hypothetical protein